MTTAEVVFLDARAARRTGAAPPRLRFDRVVLGVFSRLRAGLAGVVPEGVTVVVTLTAPIRHGAKTTVVVEDKVRALLGKGGARSGRFAGTVHGNEVQVRLVRGSGRTPVARLAGFVHNRDSDPTVLFESIGSLVSQIDLAEPERAARRGDRWLVVASNDSRPWVQTYKHVCAQLFAQTDYERVFFVDADLGVSLLGD